MADPPQLQVSATARNALMFIAVIAGAVGLFLLRSILTPLALALFLMVIIDGLSRVLRTRFQTLREPIALALAVLVTVAAFGGTVLLIAGSAPSFIGQLVADTPRLNAVIHDVSARLHIHSPPTVQRLARQLDPAKYAGGVAQTLQGLISSLFSILLYLGFLFASRPGFNRKIERLFPTRDERGHALQAFQHIRNGIERYLWIQTVTGLMIAIASAVILMAVGMQNAIFWAFLILVTSYVPIIGGMAGQFLPPLFALVEFNTYWQPGVILAGLSVVQMIMGSVVFPRMQGRSLNLDPVVILLALSFWGLVWGVPGMFLSTPLTVALMVVCEQFPASRWIAILLSSDGQPEAADHTFADPSAAPQSAPDVDIGAARAGPVILSKI